MLRVTLRNLLARKLRLALSAFAIVLGVAFVAGSFIFTDALGGAFNGIIDGTTPTSRSCPRAAVTSPRRQDARTIPGARCVDELAALPEARSADGTDQVQGVYVIGSDGELVGGNGPPGLRVQLHRDAGHHRRPDHHPDRRRAPGGESEVALDERTADKAGYDIGDEVELVTPGPEPTMTATLTGLVEFGSEGGLAGATITVFDEQAIQDLFFDGRDVYTSIALTAADGVSQQQLADAAGAVLPEGVEARTGDDLAEENNDALAETLGFINTFLLVFAAVAMVVGTFLIVNTFSILVAQRSRELALLRAMGAQPPGHASVLVEAFVVGFVGSTVGIGVGYLLALGLRALFATFGLDIGRLRPDDGAAHRAWSYAVGWS